MGHPSLTWKMVGGSNYVGQTFVTWKVVGVSEPTYGSIPHAEVGFLDGCPTFASAYVGRK
jgi:hypothetical protein